LKVLTIFVKSRFLNWKIHFLPNLWLNMRGIDPGMSLWVCWIRNYGQKLGLISSSRWISGISGFGSKIQNLNFANCEISPYRLAQMLNPKFDFIFVSGWSIRT
jgi:hypothetical protein